MIILNCAFNKKIGKKPIYETFDNFIGQDGTRGLGGLLISLFLIFIVVLAIIIAVRCNPNNQFVYALIAFLFSEIYLIQFFIRKYIIQEKNYCSGIF